MKIISCFLLALFLLTFTNTNLFAQNKNLTIILLRHAEKDTSPEVDDFDPALSPEGKLRSERLVKILKKYNTRRIYSTSFKRTRLTVTPWAENADRQYRLPIQIYDAQKLNEFADFLMQGKTGRIVVVGHSNSIPRLANLLIKQQKYKDLEESEYNKIWIIKIRGNKVKEKVIEY